MTGRKIKFCTRDAKSFPATLFNIPDPPGGFYYTGNLGIACERSCIAVIGSRNISENGAKAAYYTGRTAARMGFCVVNGLALGCDTEAIRGVLSCQGRCIAVLPCGLDQTVPRANRFLAEEILKSGGCLISEYKPYSQLQKYQYIRRDRLVSGLSHGIIIIEAGKNSGTMHTAEFARIQEREIACLYPQISENADGNREILEWGNIMEIKTKKDLRNFLSEIMNRNDTYEQMTLDTIL